MPPSRLIQALPAAVTDLTVQPRDGGRVELSWPAPGDNGREGQAAWYQLKNCPARFVERAQGWPDRSPPLLTTAAAWEARAAAFNKKQRAFSAATNHPCPLRPQAAGKKETLILGPLVPGRYFFALKAWDRSDNMSPLSNVVEVEVK